MTDAIERTASKVPEVTLGFWIIKILATTLGETGGDTVTMTLDWGYLAGPLASAVIGALILACIFTFPQRAGQHPERLETAP